VCVLAVLGGILLIGLGALGYGDTPGVWLLTAGGVLVFFAVVALTVAPLLAAIESAATRQSQDLRNLEHHLAEQTALLHAVVENTRISDAAKAFAHRDEELAALRDAIHENVRNERWESAVSLVAEMERRFGFKEEADRLRRELSEAHRGAIETRMAEAGALIEQHFATWEWDRARGEIDRLSQIFPDHPQVRRLTQRMQELRAQRKEELRKAWDDAVRRNDVDHAIDILKDLDGYLMGGEGEALRDAARHVFKEKLLQLGVQFRFAVSERRWQDALESGLELVREFPNSRMAGEVRDTLDVLRERARSEPRANPESAPRATPGT